ncbi:MAG TPA: ABC transporter ATP-binding protein [Trueperaceae bacterium]
MNSVVPPDSLGEERSEQQTNVWRFLLTVNRLLSWRFAALVLLTLVIGSISGLSLVLLMPMLQVVGLEVTGGAGERLVESVFQALSAFGLRPTLLAVLCLNAAAVILTAILTRYQAVFSARTNQAVVRRLRQRLYASICRAEWLFIARQRPGRLTHVLLGELDRVGAAVASLVTLLVGCGRVLAYGVVAFVLSPAMTVLTLACGLLLALLLLRQTQLGRRAGAAVSNAYGDLYSATGEHLAGLKFTKSHALEEAQTRAFNAIADWVARTHVEVVRNQAEVGFFLQAGTVIALSVIIYFAFEVLALPLATVLLLIYLFSRLLPMVASVQRSYQALIGQLPAFAHVQETLARSEAAAEAPVDEPAALGLARQIELRDVEFRYRGGQDRAALDRIRLLIPAGRTTALVGPSGSGKSTIADLVTGLLAPDSGEVLVDGVPLTGDRRLAWRASIAYVSQEVFLFNDTIEANLRLARPGASEAEIWEALEAASAGFVRSLPQGLATNVGDRGSHLSGGERQRLVLARALLRRPQVLVLDEATSSLDAQNEERVREAIERLGGSMTILVIAHRLASIRMADAIHVVSEGRIVETGSWRELMGNEEGLFRALALAQGLTGAQDRDADTVLVG